MDFSFWKLANANSCLSEILYRSWAKEPRWVSWLGRTRNGHLVFPDPTSKGKTGEMKKKQKSIQSKPKSPGNWQKHFFCWISNEIPKNVSFFPSREFLLLSGGCQNTAGHGSALRQIPHTESPAALPAACSCTTCVCAVDWFCQFLSPSDHLNIFLPLLLWGIAV